MKRVIHINQHVIRSNKKTDSNDPVITCKTYKDNIYGYEADFINGKVIYSKDKPLSCGARVWIETNDPVKVLTESGWVTL
mgnify:CR=1 FL=1|tara:strand:+ start:1751 stop:1990 length:240 start_codon:yes stop_codon:yes gene_type:complete